MLEVNSIDVYYGGAMALQNVSLKVFKNEIVALLGPNGAGKSTLLNTISGILRAKKGTINFLGEEVSKLPPEKRVEKGLVLIPEGRKVFPYMTVLENLEIGAYTKRARERKNENLNWILNELFPQLKDKLDRLALNLSGGEQQMLVIGRALMSQPILLMLDEPSLGLAPIVLSRMYEAVMEIHKRGTTILIADQAIDLISNISNRVYILREGRIIKEGRLSKLVEAEYVQNLLGGSVKY